MLLAIACLTALWRGELAWLVLFGLLAGFTRPSLAYLLLPFALALVLLRQPGRWKLLAAAVGVLLLGRVRLAGHHNLAEQLTVFGDVRAERAAGQIPLPEIR